MKSLFGIFAIILSSTALAANEGPQATPPAPRIIAAVEMVDGFVYPPIRNGIRILESGVVVHFEKKLHAPEPEVLTNLLVLSYEITEKLKEKIAAVKKLPLIDFDKNVPECMDAGNVNYFVYPSNDLQIKIGMNANCHNWAMENGEGSDLRALLKNLYEMSGF